MAGKLMHSGAILVVGVACVMTRAGGKVRAAAGVGVPQPQDALRLFLAWQPSTEQGLISGCACPRGLQEVDVLLPQAARGRVSPDALQSVFIGLAQLTKPFGALGFIHLHGERRLAWWLVLAVFMHA